MTEQGPLVELEVRDDVAYITLNSPPLNILTAAMMGGICDAAEKVAANDRVKAVAFRANGKAFSAGADVEEHRPEQAPDMIAAFSRMFTLLGGLEVPIVMAVDGVALGGGFELTMMADVLLATERAKFGQPEICIGFFAPLGVAYLPQLVGPQRAMEITCGGRAYSAEEMRDFGFVSYVVPSAELDERLEKTLKGFRAASPLVMRLNVRTLKQVLGKPMEEARKAAEKVFLEQLMKTEDVQEGIASFYEKRKPDWKNR
ncbi:MAG: enoyl-CoA hydratase/isomerase family protein [bacterium]